MVFVEKHLSCKKKKKKKSKKWYKGTEYLKFCINLLSEFPSKDATGTKALKV